MDTTEIKASSLIIYEYTRLQCMLGCSNYNRNPMCPPMCPDVAWFKNLIASYDHCILCYKIINFDDNVKLGEQRRSLQRKMLEEEYALKRKGHFFAVSFFPGPCSICDNDPCKLTKCIRPSVGRAPICSTGVNIAQVCQNMLNIPTELHTSYWQPLYPKEYIKEIYNRNFSLGFILY